MSDVDIYSELVNTLNKDFSLDETNLPAKNDIEFIRVYLVEKIKELMARDYGRFINNLYRIDVDEAKVNEILYDRNKTAIPARLADLIIERQLLRIKTRMMYRNGKL
ncbi:hypothetical protein [Melioribacter sp. OK-6-Me]|uniref:hypothetical protein n=1 Tax=unclassified Melioribacter TaxID=2627329 RepID=UPI003ED96387